MPNNILYRRGFSLTIGKRSGNRPDSSCTDKNRDLLEKINETRAFFIHQSTEERGFERLLQRLRGVKMLGVCGEEIVDIFSTRGLPMPLWSLARGQSVGFGDVATG